MVEILDLFEKLCIAREQYREDLADEVVLRKARLASQTYQVVIDEHFAEKKEEAERLQWQSRSLESWKDTLHFLKQKYLAIANGEPHDGRYKTLGTRKIRETPRKLIDVLISDKPVPLELEDARAKFKHFENEQEENENAIIRQAAENYNHLKDIPCRQ